MHVSQGIICTGATLIIELFPKEIRAYFKVCTFFTWSGGIMVLSLIGYLFRDINWRYMQIGLVIFSAYSLVEWWYVRNNYNRTMHFKNWRKIYTEQGPSYAKKQTSYHCYHSRLVSQYVVISCDSPFNQRTFQPLMRSEVIYIGRRM